MYITRRPTTLKSGDCFKARVKGVSISNPAFCTLSNMGGLINLLIWLHKRIEEKSGEVGKVHPRAQSFLVSISSRMFVRLSRPVHLLGVHVSRFDVLTPKSQFMVILTLMFSRIAPL